MNKFNFDWTKLESYALNVRSMDNKGTARLDAPLTHRQQRQHEEATKHLDRSVYAVLIRMETKRRDMIKAALAKRLKGS